jgi:subtilisin
LKFGLGRVRQVTAIAFVLIQLLSVGVIPRVQEAHAAPAQTRQVAPGRYIVRLKPTSAGFTSAASVAATYDAKPGVKVDQVYNSIFSGFAGNFTDSAARDLARDPNVLDVLPDGISTLQAQSELPGIKRISANLNPTKAGDGANSVDVDVAVIDTGVTKHSDLNVFGGKDCTSTRASGPYTDLIGHGTHVAGTIGARDNTIGVVGVAPGARIWAVKVFSDGTQVSYDSETICGLDYVRSMAGTIDVVNLSLGGYLGYDLGSCSAHPYHQAYCNVVNAGVTVVVAAGNDSSDARYYVPAQFDEVITVSAFYDTDGLPGGFGSCNAYFDCDDEFATFSNYGADVDLAAPGVDILSTSRTGGYEVMSGTSMASPHVAGGAALVIAQQGRMSPASVKARLQMTGQPGGLPWDPDGIKEPILNVAYLGKGKITAPSSAKVGDSIQVRVGDFTPTTRALFRFNGTYIGGDTIDDAGRGHRNYTIPNMPAGTYQASVSNGLKTVTKNVKVVSSVSVNRTSATVGETVRVTLRGYGKGETVTIKFGSKTMGTKTVSSSGYGQYSFVVPATVGGNYAITGASSKNSATANLKVAGSAWLRSGTPSPGATVYVSYRGFKSGEVIQYLYDSQSGPVINTPTEIASTSGSGDDSITIPVTSTVDSHYVWLIGNQGTKVRISLSIAAAAQPEPTATPAPIETATPEPTVDAPTQTPEPTVEAPTETATPEPTVEMPTETPTVEVPTETPVPSGADGTPAAG